MPVSAGVTCSNRVSDPGVLRCGSFAKYAVANFLVSLVPVGLVEAAHENVCSGMVQSRGFSGNKLSLLLGGFGQRC